MSSATGPLGVGARLHLDYVDGIRALAALIVYFNHAYGMVWNNYFDERPEGWLGFTRYSLVVGHLCVTVFIVVSGFCLALPVIEAGGVLRGGLGGFFKRRARRILPPYYAALLLCLALIGTFLGKQTMTIWDVATQLNRAAVVSHFLLFQDLIGTGRINYVFWSIAVEWHIYFAMPVLVWLWRRRGAAAVVVGSLAFGYGLLLFFGHTRIARAHPYFLGMFALGMFAAHVVRAREANWLRLRERVPWGLVLLAGLAVVTALILALGVDRAIESFELLDFPVGILSTALLVYASRENLVRRLLCLRPLVWIGTFSYSLYLVHAPLLQVQWQYVLEPLGVGKNARFLAMLTLGVGFVLAVSYVFHRLFEAPFMGKARPALATPSPAPAAAPESPS
jgi:peptidoglycan/LPS O-acetylase OafA/YrhL